MNRALQYVIISTEGLWLLNRLLNYMAITDFRAGFQPIQKDESNAVFLLSA